MGFVSRRDVFLRSCEADLEFGRTGQVLFNCVFNDGVINDGLSLHIAALVLSAIPCSRFRDAVAQPANVRRGFRDAAVQPADWPPSVRTKGVGVVSVNPDLEIASLGASRILEILSSRGQQSKQQCATVQNTHSTLHAKFVTVVTTPQGRAQLRPQVQLPVGLAGVREHPANASQEARDFLGVGPFLRLDAGGFRQCARRKTTENAES